MTRIRLLIFTLLVVTLFTACEDRLYVDKSEMLDRLQEESRASSDLSQCAFFQLDDDALLIGMSGDEPAYNYYAARFSVNESNECSFEKTIPLYDVGWGLRICKWHGGNVLLCNNKDAVAVDIKITTSTEEINLTEEIDSLPWSFFLDLSDYQEGYEIKTTYRDEKGNIVQ